MANQEEKKDNAFVGFFKKIGTSTKSWFKDKGKSGAKIQKKLQKHGGDVFVDVHLKKI